MKIQHSEQEISQVKILQMLHDILRFGVFILVADVNPVAVQGEAYHFFVLRDKQFDQVGGIEEGVRRD